MSRTPRPSVAIINRNYPPRRGITGESASKLARFLQQDRDAEVFVVTTKGNYGGGSQAADSVGNVVELASLYGGKNKLLRLFSSIVESYRLVRATRSLKTDRIIVMTDPPFLSFWASILLRKKEWGLWAMDLYPDAFVAAGLVTQKNPIYRWLRRNVYNRAPSFLIALGPLQARYLFTQYNRKIRTAILPCGVYQHREISIQPEWKTRNAGKVLFGYCGNLGDAHSPEFLVDVIRNLEPTKHHLVLSVYGSQSQSVRKLAEERSDLVTIVPSVPRDQLSHIDVHLASLCGHWSHVCVPSKVVSSICAGSSFLFYGVPDCDNWLMLGESGWLVEECQNPQVRSEKVRCQLVQITPEAIRAKKEAAKTNRFKLEYQVEVGMNSIGNYLFGVRAEDTAPSNSVPATSAPSNLPLDSQFGPDWLGSVQNNFYYPSER